MSINAGWGRHWPGILALALLCGGCDRHVRVVQEMQWECRPAERDPRYPDAEPVLFRYVEDPDYQDLASGRGLCQQLQGSGKTTVPVTFQVWGNSWQGLRGYDIELVDGQALRNAGGPGRSGGRDNGRPHPLAKALR